MSGTLNTGNHSDSTTLASSILVLEPDPNRIVNRANFEFSEDLLKFPYVVTLIVVIWLAIGVTYLIFRWRQKQRAMYIIPRVFVLCSPRTVQFHYEMILRVGLPSHEFNPEKHDIDITVLGQQRNEVVPMTRLNTRTLSDEPLITSLSIVVYRLVELPPLSSLVLKHSGPYRAWLYVYDFTVIDLSTNREQYFTINQYVGSLNRALQLDEPNGSSAVVYPIDDVPLPQWTNEDIFLVILISANCIMLSTTLLPVDCNYVNDLFSIAVAALHGLAVTSFCNWLVFYYARWNQERREYFNITDSCACISNENIVRICLLSVAILTGASSIYFGLAFDEWKSSIIWLLVVLNTSTLVIGLWVATSQADLGEAIVSLGLKFRGYETGSIGMSFSEFVSDIQTKSGSASDEGGSLSVASKLARSFGPRSSVKSFGFDSTGALKKTTVNIQTRGPTTLMLSPQQISIQTSRRKTPDQRTIIQQEMSLAKKAISPQVRAEKQSSQSSSGKRARHSAHGGKQVTRISAASKPHKQAAGGSTKETSRDKSDSHKKLKTH